MLGSFRTLRPELRGDGAAVLNHAAVVVPSNREVGQFHAHVARLAAMRQAV